MLKISKYSKGQHCLTNSSWIKLLILTSSLALGACQTTPSSKIVNKKTTSATTAISSQAVYKPLLLSKNTIAGLTDINWDIVSLKSKNPQVFINQPYLFLQATNQRVAGSTGCNALRGGYEVPAANNIVFQALAGHMSCNNALAQEADILDVLSRTKTYQLQQNMLFLYDEQGQLLLTAKRR